MASVGPSVTSGPLSWARGVWDAYARADAPWAVLATRDMDHFWKSGEGEIAALAGRGLISPTSRVADLGCGMGRLSLPLARRVAAVTAIDVSAEMLARVQSQGAALLNLQTWQLQDGAFPPGPFDVVVSFLVLQHQPPHVARELLSGARAALAEGGRICIDLPIVGWEPPSGAQTGWRDIPASQLWESRLYSWEDAQALLFAPAGLRVVTVEEGVRPDRRMIVLESDWASNAQRALARAQAAALEAAAVIGRYYLDLDPVPGFMAKEPRWRLLAREQLVPPMQRLLRRAQALAFPREAELRRLMGELCQAVAQTATASTPAPPKDSR